jgi:phosphatidyl-myo-inositol alpha-mannosyltransferase
MTPNPPRTCKAPERLSVCMLIPDDISLPSGAVKHHALQLASRLRRLGDEVKILALGSKEVDDPDVCALSGGIDVGARWFGRPLGLLVSPLKIWRYFRDNRFDVVHVHEPLTPVLATWATYLAPRLPRLCTFHTQGGNGPSYLETAERLLAAVQLPWFDRAIAVSRPVARHAAALWKRPLRLIPNGVRTDIFRPRSSDEPDDEPLRLLFVGRPGDERKGFSVLLEAYQRLLTAGVEATLEVVGEVGHEPLPPRLRGLTYHGALQLGGLLEQYQRASVVVAPSTSHEVFGSVLLEAMACGKPIVCSSAEGSRELVHSDGAMLVEPRNPAVLAHALTLLARAPTRRQRMGRSNRSAALAFDWYALVPQIRDEYVAAIEDRQFDRCRARGLPVAVAIAPPSSAHSTARASDGGSLQGARRREAGVLSRGALRLLGSRTKPSSPAWM